MTEDKPYGKWTVDAKLAAPAPTSWQSPALSPERQAMVTGPVDFTAVSTAFTLKASAEPRWAYNPDAPVIAAFHANYDSHLVQDFNKWRQDRKADLPNEVRAFVQVVTHASSAPEAVIEGFAHLRDHLPQIAGAILWNSAIHRIEGINGSVDLFDLKARRERQWESTPFRF